MTDLKKRATEVYRRLGERHPDAKCSLDFTNAFELLIATILSAQSTDARVNIVTKSLFRKYPNPASFANADLVAMETDVKQTGFFRNKAKAVINCSKAIMERHAGQVPRTMEELVELPGVGRKTANVVLGNAMKTNVGVVVDTHVGRVSGRLGLTESADPVVIEQDLMRLVPRETWTQFAHRMIYHGRETCIARKPQCEVCVVNDLCPSAQITAQSPSPAATRPKAGRQSRPSSKARTARSAKPSSESPSRSRTSQTPRGRKRSS
jgi:endonuclease III